jgi:DNA polymerase III sliding clamp (beta) subunit (PCNA family)
MSDDYNCNPNICGVCFEPLKDKILRLATTDGYRISMYDYSYEKTESKLKRRAIFIENKNAVSGNQLDKEFILPRQAVIMFQKIFDTEGCFNFELKKDNTHLVGSYRNICFAIRLIDKKFPDYRVVTDRGSRMKYFTVDACLLLEKLKNIATVPATESRGTEVTFNNKKIKLFILSRETGACIEDSIDIIETNIEGGFEFNFNADYAVDILQVQPGKQVIFSFSEHIEADDKPAITENDMCFKVSIDDDKSHNYFIMPMLRE